VDDDQPLYIRSKINDAWKSQKGKFQKPKALAHRVRIYLLYTVPSFHRQENQNFTPWLDCRKGSQKQMKPYMPALEEAGVYVTFDGGAALACEHLDAGRSALHITRIDSDDMFDPIAVDHIRSRTPEQRHSIFIRGYVWVIKTKRLTRIHHDSPPLYTLCLPLAATGPVKPAGFHGHNGVRRVMRPKVIAKRLFLMTRHGKHVGGGPLAHGPTVHDTPRDNVIARYRLLKPAQHWEEQNAKEVLKFVRRKR
jgi:hypothetical protein